MTKQKKFLQKAISILVTVLLVVSVALCVSAVVQVANNGYASIGGLMIFRVVTGSMEPTIPTGALLIARQTAIETVQVGDIVCFRSTEAVISGMTVTHRVVAVDNKSTGEAILKTKGDANTVADTADVDADHFIGKVIWYSGGGSLLASIASLFSGNIFFLGCVIFPILLLSGIVLRDSVRSIRDELVEAEKEATEEQEKQQNDPLGGMTQAEFDEMYERIRTETIEELKCCDQEQQHEASNTSDN